MKSVFPLDVHRLRENSARQQMKVPSKSRPNPLKPEDTDSNEIDLTPKKPPMTVAACKFRRKLESLWSENFAKFSWPSGP
jgi:hypothetical protein